VPVAFVVARPGVAPGGALSDELRHTVAERLGPLKVVERVDFVAPADLPRNAMGKVLKRELRARLAPAG
jgi:acyl-coenzyme A synthetase/AMP-(fatty) acid ligase